MATAFPDRSLRPLLIADAAACAAAGVALLLLAGVAAGLLGLPAGLLRGAGLVLLPVAAWVGLLAAQQPPRHRMVAALIGLNLAWAAASVGLLVTGWVAPTGLGTAFVLVQAVLVGGFALLEARALAGLRRTAPRGVTAAPSATR